jgi:hypothetical protein
MQNNNSAPKTSELASQFFAEEKPPRPMANRPINNEDGDSAGRILSFRNAGSQGAFLARSFPACFAAHDSGEMEYACSLPLDGPILDFGLQLRAAEFEMRKPGATQSKIQNLKSKIHRSGSGFQVD